MARDPTDVANELYERGFTLTRDEATALVNDDPTTVATLLGLPSIGAEMRHPDDRAHLTGEDGWGHADTGAP